MTASATPTDLFVPDFARIVRPFVVLDSKPAPAAPTGQPTDLGALAPVVLSWGAPGAVLQFVDANLRSANPYDSVPKINDPTLGASLEVREISRQTSRVRVENPADPVQYVDIERIEEIVFAAPDGTQFRHIMTNEPEL